MAQFKRMRLLVLVLLVTFVTSSKAQTFVPGRLLNDPSSGFYTRPIATYDSSFNKKWFFSTYSAVNTSFFLTKGGSATMIATPIGLQLNRRLNKNLYAFAGISAAPAYININRSFITSGFNEGQNHGLYQRGNLNLYSRAELGLQYVNDEKTFSISGSIGIQRSSNPFLPYTPVNDKGVNRVMPVMR